MNLGCFTERKVENGKLIWRKTQRSYEGGLEATVPPSLARTPCVYGQHGQLTRAFGSLPFYAPIYRGLHISIHCDFQNTSVFDDGAQDIS